MVERGFGYSLSTTRVMMPSVPSDPDEEMLQVVAGVVLDELVEAGHDGAVGQYHLETEHRVRASCRSG